MYRVSPVWVYVIVSKKNWRAYKNIYPIYQEQDQAKAD